jgi:PST family polysaccharide transporter
MSDQTEAAVDTRKLDRAFIGGVGWTAGAKWLSQLISWPSMLIMANLLSPSDFGLVEMAGFYITVTNVMAEFGIGMAVLQMRELDRRVTAQLNTLAVLSGVLAFLLSVAVAPLMASFFHAPALNLLIVVTSLTFILTSLEAIPLGLLQRDMAYRRLSATESAQAVITALVSVAAAWAGLGYWAIIAGNLLGRAANIALAIYWRPVGFARPVWNEVVKPMRFGLEIAVQRIASALNGISDVVVIGRVMGAGDLGVYRMATNLASAPSDKIGALIMRVTGPLFARVQADKELMLRYFLLLTEALSIGIFPLLFGLAMVAEETVALLFKPEWASAAGPLRWLAVFMTFRTLSYLLNQVLTALRFTRFGMWISGVNFVLMPVSFYIASRWGVGAVAAAWLVTVPVTMIPVAVRVLGDLKCGVGRYASTLAPSLVGSAAMLAAVWGVRHVAHFHGWRLLSVEVAVGAVAYTAILLGVFRPRIMRFVRFLRDLRNPQKAELANV